MNELIQTNSRRSFGEHSFSTWREVTENTQKEASYGSDFRRGESQQFYSTEVSETRSGSPGSMFKWSARESTSSSNRMMYGTMDGMASSKDRPTITELNQPHSPSMRKPMYTGGLGTSFNESGYHDNRSPVRNEQLLLTGAPNPPSSQMESPVLCDGNVPVVTEYIHGVESVKPTLVESPVHANSGTFGNTGLNATFGDTFNSQRSYEQGALTKFESPQALENVGERDGKAAWSGGDGGMEAADSSVGARPSQGNRTPSTSSQQLPPVMEDAHYVGEKPISVGNQNFQLPSDQISMDSSIGPSRSVSSRECRENMHTLAQRPWGSSVSQSSVASEGVCHHPWIGQSIEALDIDEVAATREIRQKYKNKLGCPRRKMIGLGRLCAKSMWFWVGLIAVVAGIEGFNEGDSATYSQPGQGEDLWSDEEND